MKEQGVNEREFKRIIKVLGKLSGDDLVPFLGDVGRRLISDFRMGFKSATAPDGSKWKPLKYREGQPLRDTGRLQSSITKRLDRTSKTLEIGTNVDYATTHQFGLGKVRIPQHTKLINHVFGKPLDAPKKVKVKAHTKNANIPARPFLGIERRQKSKIAAAFEQHIRNLTDGNAK